MIPRTLFPSELPDDRRIRKLSRVLGVHVDIALAIVVRLWCYSSRQLDGGDLVQHDPEDLADAAGYSGNGADLAGALFDSLLAEKIDGGLRLVLYHEANAAYVAERAYNIARLKTYREKQREQNGNTNAVANAVANPSSGLVLSGLVCEKETRTRTRERGRSPAEAGAPPRTYREWEPPDEGPPPLARSSLKQSPGPLGEAKSESPAEKAKPIPSPRESGVPIESIRKVVTDLQALIVKAELEGDDATARRLRAQIEPYVALLPRADA